MKELPDDFIGQTDDMLGKNAAKQLYDAISTSPIVSVRQNREKLAKLTGQRDVVLSVLNKDFIEIRRVPWCESGYYLHNRPSYTLDPFFHAGCYYPQEASSMFLEQAIRRYVKGPVKALDLCAAPGGKSTHLCSLLPKGSVIISNEVVRARGAVLVENLIKWGATNSIVTMNSAKDIGDSGLHFDFILVDAPCSGEGMFRKDKKAIDEWSLDNVRMCAERQRSILKDIWPALQPGGILVYSTCTYNKAENEQNIIWAQDVLEADVLQIPVPKEWGVSGSAEPDYTTPVYRFFPHMVEGEGLFMAVLQKSKTTFQSIENTKTSVSYKKSNYNLSEKVCNSWLENSNSYMFDIESDRIFAYPLDLVDYMWRIQSKLRCLSCGIEIGRIKGGVVIPSHQLAMSQALKKSSFTCVELSLEQALDYLHYEAVQIPYSPQGVVLFTYYGVPLGFAKNVGNRANNMYPKRWRIRKQVR
ncbi:MAG TPA: rRNA cytosine-C5-methyltransferase [Bacteroidaceae bacterium]|nr:rRNA cytosine-C5-methyltransferase [Bacteroidaceae bacterium]